jgi:F-type H+-transporting ATPase subunit delta
MALALVGASRESFAAARERLESGNLGADALRQLGEELFSVAELLYREGALRRALSDPAMTREAKIALIDSLVESQLGRDTLDVAHGLVGARWSRPRDLVDVTDLLGAEAVFASAEAQGELADVEDELFRFSRVLEQQPEFAVALTNSAIPIDARLHLLHDVLEGKVRSGTLRLVEEVVRAPRGRPLDRALHEFVRLAAARRQKLVAEVWSAVRLTEAQETRLSAGLERQYGRAVALQVTVDEAVLGGLTVRIGDEVIEGSIATRLIEARRLITG